jgi:hypothetical protein
METPILFLIFNRPDTTKIVFEAIRQIKPKKLFIAADGPRANRPAEADNCAATRAITEQIDWDCQVIRDYSAINLGCKKRVSTAIGWFFSQVEQGIILEDDCLPNPSFFNFCETLLEKYKNDERIMHVSGNNFLFGKIKIDADYYFSRISHVWGWASWRRAWQKYDSEMKDFPEFIAKNKIVKIFPDKFLQKKWLELFQSVYDHKIDTWDYQWEYAILKAGGLCLNPRVNLISNIGFSGTGTHTTRQSKFSNLPTESLIVKTDPNEVKPNAAADNLIIKNNLQMSRFFEVKKFILNIAKIVKLK